MTRHPLESISAYADGELPAHERAAVEHHLADCTECTRELALIRSMGEAMLNETQRARVPERLWTRVHRRITQPLGWLLVVAGVAVWMALGLTEWLRAGELTWVWLATTAIGIGAALLMTGIAFAQYQEWRNSPYREIDR